MKKNSSSSSSGFTLLELLIVVSILAVLATVVVIVINPAQILTRARDSNRLSELASLNKALQIAQVQGISFFGSPNTVYVSIPDSSSACSNLGLPPLPSGWSYACVSSSTYKDADSTGWIPINFNSLPSGSPLSVLPVDPVNSTTNDYYYTYTADSSNWELTALLESSDRHDQAINDGDAFPGVYSLGTSKGLTPATRDMGLVGYWKMDEGTGTSTVDSSGNGNIGSLINSPVWTAGCKVGNCLTFNGTSTNSYVNAGDNSSLRPGNNGKDFTWCLWVKPGSQVSRPWLGKGRGITDGGFPRAGFTFGQANVDTAMKIESGDGVHYNYTWALANAVVVDNWSFYCLAYIRNNGVYVYMNGGLKSFETGTGDGYKSIGDNIGAAGNSFFVGRDSQSHYFNGSIDDVRIYNRALSGTEVSAIYNATK